MPGVLTLVLILAVVEALLANRHKPLANPDDHTPWQGDTASRVAA
jgi:hypothetical protein